MFATPRGWQRRRLGRTASVALPASPGDGEHYLALQIDTTSAMRGPLFMPQKSTMRWHFYVPYTSTMR
jgi:hypothetical protein